MPPDVGALVRKFVPNNAKLARVILKVCEEVFRSRWLPIQLIKLLVDRALEEIRRSGEGTDYIESKQFYEKMLEHAKSIRPRFQAKIAEMSRKGGRV